MVLGLEGNPNQKGNLHYGNFWDRYFEQLPYVPVYVKPNFGFIVQGRKEKKVKHELAISKS